MTTNPVTPVTMLSMLEFSGLATAVTFAAVDHHYLSDARQLPAPSSMVHIPPVISAALAEQAPRR